MSTEATGDGQSDAVGAVEPDKPAASAEPAATVVAQAGVVTEPAVAEPAVTAAAVAGPSVAARTAWDTAPSAWGTPEPAEVPEPEAILEAAEVPEPAQAPETASVGEPAAASETAEVPETAEAGEGAGTSPGEEADASPGKAIDASASDAAVPVPGRAPAADEALDLEAAAAVGEPADRAEPSELIDTGKPSGADEPAGIGEPAGVDELTEAGTLANAGEPAVATAAEGDAATDEAATPETATPETAAAAGGPGQDGEASAPTEAGERSEAESTAARPDEPAGLNELDEPDDLDDPDEPGLDEPGLDDEHYDGEPYADEADETDELNERYNGYADSGAAGYDEVYQEYDEYEVEEAVAPPRARRWPRVLLGLGFVVLAAVIVGGAIAIVGSVTHGFKKPVKVTYTKSALFNLKTGECFDPRGQSYTLISCDSPHEAEVFATFKLSGSKWPGTTAIAADASSGCATRLTGYLNPQLAISLSSTYVYPDSVAWQAGTRTVICEVRATSGNLTGSVRGASATSG